MVKAYKERFSAFSQDIFKSMEWLNQANWDLAEKNYGINDLLFLADHFKDTLDESKFELDCFKRMVNQNYGSIKTPLSMWQRILTYQASEFKNVCMIAKICLSIGTSNSTVERGFSLLSTILTDRRLRISHKAMENCLLIAANSVNFASTERDEIITNAVGKYLQKRRKLPESGEPQRKRCRLMLSESSDDDSTDLNAVKDAADLVAHCVVENSDDDDLSSEENNVLEAEESENSDINDENISEAEDEEDDE